MEKIKLEHCSINKLKKNILEIIRKYLNLDSYQIFFFGSSVDEIVMKRIIPFK